MAEQTLTAENYKSFLRNHSFQLIKISVAIGGSVKITKKEAMAILSKPRDIFPMVEATELLTGKWIITILPQINF